MSHIFDALQRSEAEQTGAEPLLTESTFAVATELLEAAERKRQAGGSANGSTANARKEIDSRELDSPELPSALDDFPSLPVSILPDSRLVAVGEKESLGAEKFRFLAVRLLHIHADRQHTDNAHESNPDNRQANGNLHHRKSRRAA